MRALISRLVIFCALGVSSLHAVGAFPFSMWNSPAAAVNTPPNYSSVLEWWDARPGDFSTTGAGKIVNSWTGRKSGTVSSASTTARAAQYTDISSNIYLGFSYSVTIPGSFTSGTFADGDVATQAATGAYGIVQGTQSSGGTLTLIDGQTGAIIEDSSSVWTNQSSTATFTPSGFKSAPVTPTNYYTGSLTYDRRNSAVFIVTGTGATGSASANIWSSTSDTDAIYLENGAKVSHYNGGTTLNPTIYIGSGMQVLYVNNNGATDITIGNSRNTPGSINNTGEDTAQFNFGLNPSGNATTISIGAGISGGSPIQGTLIRAVVVYNRTLSSGEVNSFLDWATTTYGAAARNEVTFLSYVGDSITSGIGSALYEIDAFPGQVGRAAPYQNKFTNRGIPGVRVSAFSTLCDTDFARNAWATNKVLVIGPPGTNDISVYGATALDIENDLSAYVSAARSATSGVKIVCCTMLNKASFTGPQAATQAAVNTWIKAGAGTTFDYVVDTQAISQLSNSANSTYFALDQVHPNSTGYSYMGALVYSSLHAAGLLP